MPAVVGQHPAGRGAARSRTALVAAVGRKGVAVFDHFGNAGKVGQRSQLDPRRSEQIGQFDSLVTIGGAEDEHGGGRGLRVQRSGFRVRVQRRQIIPLFSSAGQMPERIPEAGRQPCSGRACPPRCGAGAEQLPFPALFRVRAAQGRANRPPGSSHRDRLNVEGDTDQRL